MTDESIINLSDETKSALRTYATMAGFFVMMATMLYVMVAVLSGHYEAAQPVSTIGSVILIIIGVILALLHKRDLFSAFFILVAFFEILFGNGLGLEFNPVFAAMFILVALAFLQNRNEQAYIVAGLLLIRASEMVFTYVDVYSAVTMIPGILMIVVCLYFTIALACERHKLPLRDYLVADEVVPENDGVPVHFKEMGSSIGYAIPSTFALITLLDSFGIIGSEIPEVFNTLESSIGIMLILTGVIMLVAGRMRGTPFYFVCAGFLFLMMSAGEAYGEGVCFVILGLMCMLRSDSRLLLGFGFVLMGVCNFIVALHIHEVLISGTVAILLFAIFTYLVFAVNSNGKLKLI